MDAWMLLPSRWGLVSNMRSTEMGRLTAEGITYVLKIENDFRSPETIANGHLGCELSTKESRKYFEGKVMSPPMRRY